MRVCWEVVDGRAGEIRGPGRGGSADFGPEGAGGERAVPVRAVHEELVFVPEEDIAEELAGGGQREEVAVLRGGEVGGGCNFEMMVRIFIVFGNLKWRGDVEQDLACSFERGERGGEDGIEETLRENYWTKNKYSLGVKQKREN